MASEQMTLLPTELTAKFRYLCKSRTIHDSLQAKCSFLHYGKEYSGILFAPDGEEWFANLTEGSLVKACRISPCEDEKYKGEYKGTALPLEQQSLDMVWQPVKTETVVIEMSNMPNVLREAASMIELLLGLVNKDPVPQPQKQVQEKLPYRSVHEWTDEIIKIIIANETFQVKPFSALSFNGYMEHHFNNFWEGDLETMKHGHRWRQQISSALRKLVDRNFIEYSGSMGKHYQLTQYTLAQLADPFND
jgi:hypothetical protein